MSARGQILGEGKRNTGTGDQRAHRSRNCTAGPPLGPGQAAEGEGRGAPSLGRGGGLSPGGRCGGSVLHTGGWQIRAERHEEHTQSEEDGLLLPESLEVPG